MRGSRLLCAALATVLLAALATAGPAVAAPNATPNLIVPGSGEKTVPFTSLKPTDPRALPGSEHATGTALVPGPQPKKIDDPAATGPRQRKIGKTAASPYCDEYIDKTIRAGRDESGTQFLTVDYYGDVLCNFYLIEASGVAGVIDRSPGHDGEILHEGVPFHFVEDYFGYSRGFLERNADLDDRARSIEVAVEVYLLADFLWGSCNPVPNLRYLRCEGLGTNLLHVVVGTGPISTGLQPPPQLYMNARPGQQGCRQAMDPVMSEVTTIEGGNGEKRATIDFAAEIHCQAGVSGVSRAQLYDRGRTGEAFEPPGTESFVDGVSEGTVEQDEHLQSGRRVRVRYAGRAVAPTGRTWGGCNDADGFTFTTCNRNGNIVDWVAVGQDTDTGLLPRLDCALETDGPRRTDTPMPGGQIESVLIAKGTTRCGGAAVVLTATARVTNPLTGFSSGGFNITPGSSVTATVKFNCDQQNSPPTLYDLTVNGSIRHASGWVETLSTVVPGISVPCRPLPS